MGELEKTKKKDVQRWGDSYILSGHDYLNISVPERRRMAKEWLKRNKNISNKDFVLFLDSLYKGKSHEEKTISSIILGYDEAYRKDVKTKDLDRWLDELVGWAEVDCLCQNNFKAEELLANWKQWQAFIRKLSKDKNINKRRASLVFLTGPVYYSNDKKIRDLAFEMINALKHEKPILISKAISWLLRSMVNQHKKETANFIDKNKNTLPKIAIRETLRKIKTGRK